MSLLTNLFVSLILASMLLFMGSAVSMKFSSDREKLSPFECGFNPKFSARLPFSIQFFMITIIFLVFDVELILIFPLVPALCATASYISFGVIFSVVMILSLGLAHEIFQGSLTWAI